MFAEGRRFSLFLTEKRGNSESGRKSVEDCAQVWCGRMTGLLMAQGGGRRRADAQSLKYAPLEQHT